MKDKLLKKINKVLENSENYDEFYTGAETYIRQYLKVYEEKEVQSQATEMWDEYVNKVNF